MKAYQEEFIQFLVETEALQFGDFTLKSGRKSPYFVNMGAIDSGEAMAKMGRFYAGLLTDRFGVGFTVLFGPAYKGIPLATAAAVSLQTEHQVNVKVTFDRKEAKGHGEKGNLMGYKPASGDRVVIIDDVFTTGATKEETVDLLSAMGDIACVGVAIAVDRQEAQSGSRSAVQIFEAERNIPVRAIVTIRQIVSYLSENEVKGKLVIDEEMRGRIKAYLSEHGAAVD